ncbi:MAG: multidrug effflux MFS transporter [Thiolinea sp.]
MSNQSAKPKHLPPIWLLILCSAIGPVAMTTPVPAVTEMMRDFATDYGSIQLMLTAYLIATGLAQLVLGALSDQFGRRPVMLAGLIIFTLGSLLCALAESLEVLLIGRFIQGVGGAAGLALSRAIVRDVYGRSQTASIIGYVNMGMVIAPMIGPTIGGLMTDYLHWHFIFVAMAGMSMFLVVISHSHLNETLPDKTASKRPSLLTSAPLLLSDINFIAYTLNISFCAGMFYSFIAGAPYYVMEVLGVNASVYGMYSIFTACGYMAGNYLSARYSERNGPDKMLKLAFIPGGIGVALLWLGYNIEHPFALFLPMFFIAVSNGLTIPNGNAAAMSTHPELAGAAAGISGAVTIGVGAIMTIIMGFVQDGGRWPLPVIISGCCLMAYISLNLVREAPRSELPPH